MVLVRVLDRTIVPTLEYKIIITTVTDFKQSVKVNKRLKHLQNLIKLKKIDLYLT